jgi:hypothetical protein
LILLVPCHNDDSLWIQFVMAHSRVVERYRLSSLPYVLLSRWQYHGDDHPIIVDIAVDATGSRCRRVPVVTLPRGGADYYDDSFTITTNDRNAVDNDGENEELVADNTLLDDSLDNTVIPERGKSVLSWLFGDFFLDDRLVDTTTTANEEHTSDATFVVHSTNTVAMNNTITQQTGRGGALVKYKTTYRNRFFLPQWLQSPFSSLDMVRVAPFASRLFRGFDTGFNNDDDNNNSNNIHDDAMSTSSHTKSTTMATKSITESVIANARSAQKVWWVDTSADHLPDDEDENYQEQEQEQDIIKDKRGSNSERYRSAVADQVHYDVATVKNETVEAVQVGNESSPSDTSFNANTSQSEDFETSQPSEKQNYESERAKQLDIASETEKSFPSDDEGYATTLAPLWNSTTTNSSLQREYNTHTQAETPYTSSGSVSSVKCCSNKT